MQRSKTDAAPRLAPGSGNEQWLYANDSMAPGAGQAGSIRMQYRLACGGAL